MTARLRAFVAAMPDTLSRMIGALFWGGVTYLWIRAMPHLVIEATGWPVVTDNHASALGFACGFAAAYWTWARRPTMETRP